MNLALGVFLLRGQKRTESKREREFLDSQLELQRQLLEFENEIRERELEIQLNALGVFKPPP